MQSIILENNVIKLELDEKGVVQGLYCKVCEKSLAVENAPFAVLRLTDENELLPISAKTSGDILQFDFGKVSVEMSAISRGDYFEIKILTDLSDEYYGLDFGCVTLKDFVDTEDSPALFSYALSENVNEHMYPDGCEGKSIGSVMTRFGTVGGRLAIVFTQKKKICDVLKKIHATLSPDDRAVSPIAGPYAREYDKNHGNYVIISQTDPANLENYIDFYTKAGVTQLDFHQGPNSFRQGDFWFHKYGGSAVRFKNEFAKPLLDAGILSGLHTYAYYIDPSCAPILSDTKWHEQLCYLPDEYTLDEELIPDQPFFRTLEDTSSFSTNHTFFSDSLPYVLIDGEILLVKPEKGGFAIHGRGCGGTCHTSHKKGAKIRHFFGRFCMFTPVIGSELFYKIARDTAKAYNEGGFEMIYLDALDGIGHHCPQGESWYWAEQFVSTIVKNCNTPPIIEYSTMYPSIWPQRGRMGAWDTPFRGFKDFVKMHINSNLEWEKRHYTTTLGWYLAYPVMDQKFPPNYTMRYQFEEDIDFVGSEAFCHGSSMVFLSLNATNFEKYPAFAKNVENYRRYSLAMGDKKLVALREKLLSNPYEKRLVEEGEKYFVEKHYKKSKIYNAGEGVDKVLYENPFEKQKPFVRLEAQLSSNGEDAVTLVHFDENSPVATGVYPFEYTDMTNRLALRVRVKGNGKNSAVILRVASSFNNGKGVADYNVFTNFTGWRTLYLAEVDNANFSEANGPVPSDFGAYSYYRSTVNYDHANRLEIYTVGDVEGVAIGDVEVCAHCDTCASEIKLSGGSATLEVLSSLSSGEYVEIYPNATAKKFDPFGNETNVELKGALPEIEEGSGELAISAVTENGLPARFTATVGATGKIIK